MDAPERKIVATVRLFGATHVCRLECGHSERLNSRERKRGKVACFECFYKAKREASR